MGLDFRVPSSNYLKRSVSPVKNFGFLTLGNELSTFRRDVNI